MRTQASLRAVVAPILAMLAAVVALPASPGPVQSTTYCISGSGNGTDWDWDLREGPLGTDPSIVNVPTPPITVSAPPAGSNATTLASSFWMSIDSVDAPVIVLTSPDLVMSCLDPANDGAFAIASTSGSDFALWVEDPANVLKPVGMTVSTGVHFNPYIYVPLPEPGVILGLSSGALLLAALRRRRARLDR